jgi:WD40 repeat protein
LGDTTLRVWDVGSGETLRTLEGHSRPVHLLAVLPDGRIVSGSGDTDARKSYLGLGGALVAWDVGSGSTLAAYTPDALSNALATLGLQDFVVGDESGRLLVFRLEEPDY